MNVFKIILMLVIAILLVIQMVGEANKPGQVKALKDSLDNSRAQFERLNTLAESLERRLGAMLDEQDRLAAALESNRVGMDLHREAFLQGLQLALSRASSGEPVDMAAIEALNTNDQEQGSSDQQVVDTVELPQGERDGVAREAADFLLEPDYSTYNPRNAGGIRKRFGSEPSEGLNSLVTSMGATSDVANMVNDGLCTKGVINGFEDRWYQGLATSCIISDDFKTFTFTIREGVYWQVPQLASTDPETYGWLAERVELTAYDFEFFLDMLMDPNVQASHLRNYYEELADWKAIDDRTLQIT